MIILDPELVEVLARGVALWVEVLVVEDLPDRLSMGLVRGAEVLPCLVLVLNALPDVVSLEEAEEKDWNLSFLVTFLPLLRPPYVCEHPSSVNACHSLA